MPRRVQYDPRAGAAVSGGPRNNMRPGGMGGRPMMGRGGAMGARRGGPPMIKRPVAVSTQEMSAHKKVIRI
jgi:hypothetical protein